MINFFAVTDKYCIKAAVHTYLSFTVNHFHLTKLGFYFSRNASELQAADILMITVIVQRIFPSCCLAIPASSTRPPPPLAHYAISNRGMSSQDVLNGSLHDHHHHNPSSSPIAINRGEDTDRHSVSSSYEEKFYSPPSTPTNDDLAHETIKAIGMNDDEFFSPRTNTPPVPQVLY